MTTPSERQDRCPDAGSARPLELILLSATGRDVWPMFFSGAIPLRRDLYVAPRQLPAENLADVIIRRMTTTGSRLFLIDHTHPKARAIITLVDDWSRQEYGARTFSIGYNASSQQDLLDFSQYRCVIEEGKGQQEFIETLRVWFEIYEAINREQNENKQSLAPRPG